MSEKKLRKQNQSQGGTQCLMLFKTMPKLNERVKGKKCENTHSKGCSRFIFKKIYALTKCQLIFSLYTA